MSDKALAEAIVDKMFRHDAFSRWLGIERVTLRPGYCRLRLLVRPEMTNGFAIAHGGIAYSLADSALAFASNGYGKQAMSLDTAIAHTRAVKSGETLEAEAVERSFTRRTGIYDVTVSNQSGETVALFRGTVYRTEKDWDLP